MKLSVATASLSLLIRGTVGIDIPSPTTGSCFTNLSEITIFELHCIFQGALGSADPACPNPSVLGGDWTSLRDTRRTYTVCPDSIFSAPLVSPDEAITQYPLGTVNPNVEIKCGESGQSSNNCVITGGNVHFLTPHPSYIGLTPTDIFQMSFLDVSNLLIRGVTFTGVDKDFGTDPDNAGDFTNISLHLPGVNIGIHDCVFKDNAVDDVIQTLFVEEAYNAKKRPGTEYMSVLIDDSVIKTTKYRFSILFTGKFYYDGWSDAYVGSERSLHVDIRNSLIGNNMNIPPQIGTSSYDYAAIILEDGVTVATESVCFINNCGLGAIISTFAWYLVSGDMHTKNNSFTCEFLEDWREDICLSYFPAGNMTAAVCSTREAELGESMCEMSPPSKAPKSKAPKAPKSSKGKSLKSSKSPKALKLSGYANRRRTV